jgi:Zn-dependent peptidase ImmA (M78 family)
MPQSVYEKMRVLANEIRAQYGFSGPRVTKSDLRRVYKDLGITVHYWDHKLKALRGAYFPPPDGPSVLIAKRLPDEPQIFTLAHELKHHLVDRDQPLSYCDPSNQNALAEKSAEVFAAELIFPQGLFIKYMHDAKVDLGACTADNVVHLKVQLGTTLSYRGLCKMAEFLGYGKPEAFAKVQFQKRQEQLYGVPLYKRLRQHGT